MRRSSSRVGGVPRFLFPVGKCVCERCGLLCAVGGLCGINVYVLFWWWCLV
jgi:hypothetical protein